MTDKQDALIEIITLMRRHDLSLTDISAASQTKTVKTTEQSNILSRLFGYIGGIFIFAGLAIFIAMQWDSMSPLGHVLVTLGCGFCLYIIALVCSSDARFEKLSTPLFLAAAVLQPLGLVVMLGEMTTNINGMYGFLLVHLLLAIQQSCTFYARRRTVLALTSLYFTLGFFAIALDLLGVPGHMTGLVIGLSLLCIGWSLDKSRHHAIAPFIYLCGSCLFLWTAYDWLDDTPFKILFLALSCGVIFLSTVVRSRMLLFTGTVALVCYIGDYMYVNFRDSLAGPVGLIFAGFLLIGIGALAVKINKRYIQGEFQQEQS